MVIFEDSHSIISGCTTEIFCGDHKDKRYLGRIHGDKYIRLTDNMFDLEELEQIVAKMKDNRVSPRKVKPLTEAETMLQEIHMLKFVKNSEQGRIDIVDANLDIRLGYIGPSYISLTDGDYDREELKAILDFKEVEVEETNEQD